MFDSEEGLTGADAAILIKMAGATGQTGNDGFLDAIKTADGMVKLKREKIEKEHTAGFLQAILAGEDPGMAYKAFPKASETAAQGFLSQKLAQDRQIETEKRAETTHQERLDESRAYEEKQRPIRTKTELDAHIARQKADFAQEKVKQEEAQRLAEQGALDVQNTSRAMNAGFLQHGQAPAGYPTQDVPPTIDQVDAGFLSQIAANQQVPPGRAAIAAPIAREQMMKEQKGFLDMGLVEANTEKARAAAVDPTEQAGFLAAVTREGRVTPEIITAFPNAYKAAGGFVKQGLQQGFQSEQLDKRLEAQVKSAGIRQTAMDARASRGDMTDDDAKYWARVQMITGELPAGLGRSGKNVAKISAFHAELAREMGVEPETYAQQKAAYSAGKKALGKDTEMVDSMEMGHRRVTSAIAILRQSSADFPRMNSLIANKGYEWAMKEVAGDPEALRYISAMSILQPEYAKLVSGNGMARALQDNQLKHAYSILSVNMGHDGLMNVLDLMEQEAQTSINGVKSTTLDRMRNISSPTLNPKDNPTPSSAAPAATGVGMEYLKKYGGAK